MNKRFMDACMELEANEAFPYRRYHLATRLFRLSRHIVRQEHTKRALVEAFGTGLKLGIGWLPPRLRREVYEALGLRVAVDGAGGMRAEARRRVVDKVAAAVMLQAWLDGRAR